MAAVTENRPSSSCSEATSSELLCPLVSQRRLASLLLHLQAKLLIWIHPRPKRAPGKSKTVPSPPRSLNKVVLSKQVSLGKQRHYAPLLLWSSRRWQGENGGGILQISPQPVQRVMKASQGLKAIWLSRVKGTLCPEQEEGSPRHLQRVTCEARGLN